MSTVIGIDLGTTNSCVAVVRDGKPEVLVTSEFKQTLPSVVSFDERGNISVGWAAKHQEYTNFDRTVASIKRRMGSRYRVRINGHDYSPESISAFILQRLKTDAEDRIGEVVTDAVITCPAYFTDAQRQATKDAGKIAGLNVKRIINEPTASALAYGIDCTEPQKVLVFDLGGGTFDCSILDIDEGIIEVMSTCGDNELGGNDIDNAVKDHFLAEFEEETGWNIGLNYFAVQRLIEAAEEAKIALSDAESHEVFLPFLATRGTECRHLRTTLTRDQLEEIAQPFVDRAMDSVRRALVDAGLGPSQIDKLLLVGGSTRMPLVRRTIEGYLGVAAEEGVDPDECVALGAALQANVLEGSGDLLLLDVVPMSLGIESYGDVCVRMIERNSRIPIKCTQIFSTATDLQREAEFRVLQGESSKASLNRLIGVVTLPEIRRALHGNLIIKVSLGVDVDGIVHVEALNTETGKRVSLDIKDSMNITREELEASIKETKRREEARRFKEHWDRTFNQLEHLCTHGAKLSLLLKDKDDRKILSREVLAAQKATKGGPFSQPEVVAAACSRIFAILSSIDPDVRENRYLMY